MTIRANAVAVARVFQAQCRLPGCDWRGDPKSSYEAANMQRTAHLDEHRAQEMGIPS
jgi:hypothetical protein